MTGTPRTTAARTEQPPEPLRARMPADVDAPDKVVGGLTWRQLAILAVAAVVAWAGWRTLAGRIPAEMLLIGAGALGLIALLLALGRRDGVSMDAWLLGALRFRAAPRTLSALETTGPVPEWITPPSPPRVRLPAPLRLPAETIDDAGQIRLTGGPDTALVAATTLNLALRTPDEQAALLTAWGSWLNSLTGPAQVVVTTQPVDLHSHADRLTRASAALDDPALVAACTDHAAFLRDLATRRDPLRRQVLIATPAAAGPGKAGAGRTPAARRRAEDTARALAGLGVIARPLDGAAATEALAATADPYRPPRPHGVAAPTSIVTGPPTPSAGPHR